MARAGNFSKLTQMREQVFYAEAVVQLAQAQRAATAQRELLTQLMGLFGEDTRFRLAERLPDLPGEQPASNDLEAKAIAQRLDIQALKLQTESLAASLGLTRATRFVNVLEFGPASTKEDPEPWKRGYEISLQLPIFDWGDARVGKAEELYMQSVHRVAEVATNARSEVRAAYAGTRTAWETTKHYRDEIVPLRKKIGDENLLRYNGMLISVFELLVDAREQVASVTAYIGALREFWLSETDLRAALNGPGGGGGRGMAGAAAGSRMIPNPALAGH
jgi:outer membrane protein TolC